MNLALGLKLYAYGDTRHAVLLLNLFGCVPFRQVGIHLVFGKSFLLPYFSIQISLFLLFCVNTRQLLRHRDIGANPENVPR